jgi:hypothetical protein
VVLYHWHASRRARAEKRSSASLCSLNRSSSSRLRPDAASPGPAVCSSEPDLMDECDNAIYP